MGGHLKNSCLLGGLKVKNWKLMGGGKVKKYRSKEQYIC